MLTRVALIAPPGLSQQRVRKHLSRPLAYVVREFQSMGEVQEGLQRFPFEVLIARLPNFQMMHVQTIEKLAQLFPQASLITVSPKIESQARYAIRGLKRHSLVDEELELGDLDNIIEKAAKPWDRSVARMHPRAKRQDEALLVTTDEMYDEDTFHDARFIDFARMGARLTVSPSPKLQLVPKSRVEIRYRSTEDLSKVHRLEARVVWIKKTQSMLSGSKIQMGLRFVAEF